MPQIEIREQKLGITRDGVVFARRGDRPRAGRERKVLTVFGNVGLDDRARRPLALKQLFGQRIFQEALDGAAQRTGAVRGIGAFLGDELVRGIGKVDGHVHGDQALAQVGHHKLRDFDDLILRQGLEHDDLVDTVEEFRPEQLLYLAHNARLDFPSDYSFYDYAVRFFNMKFTSVDLLLYVPRLLFLVPTTTFIFPTATARLICLPFGAFDMRILAVMMFLWYATVCFFIQRKFKIENKFLHCIFLLFFIVVFFNGINLTILNSLYGQSVMLVSFATVVLFGLYMFENVHDAKNSVIIFFTVSSCLLLGSKLQCAVFTPFLIIAVLYVGFKSNKRNLCIVCSIVLLWHGVGGYVINGGQLNLDTQYNSVFYGILKDSPNPKQDLIDMGLDEDMAADSGKHAYLDKSEYKYPPRSDIMNEKFHSKMSNGKLIKFYITHPLRLVSVMETTAQNAFTNKINLGTFEKKYG